MSSTGENTVAHDLRDRTFQFALRIIRLHKAILASGDATACVLARQILPSGTSIGANVAEAQSGESRADFLHKIMIAQKEARETLYWLRLLVCASLPGGDRVDSLIDEANQLVAILSTIAKRVRQSP